MTQKAISWPMSQLAQYRLWPLNPKQIFVALTIDQLKPNFSQFPAFLSFWDQVRCTPSDLAIDLRSTWVQSRWCLAIRNPFRWLILLIWQGPIQRNCFYKLFNLLMAKSLFDLLLRGLLKWGLAYSPYWRIGIQRLGLCLLTYAR